MSVELRRNDNRIECDWGVFENSEADPERGLQPLVLITAELVRQLLNDGPAPNPLGGMTSVDLHNGRMFAHLDYQGARTTWELHEARWWDDGEPEIYVGRWPD